MIEVSSIAVLSAIVSHRGRKSEDLSKHRCGAIRGISEWTTRKDRFLRIDIAIYLGRLCILAREMAVDKGRVPRFIRISMNGCRRNGWVVRLLHSCPKLSSAVRYD